MVVSPTNGCLWNWKSQLPGVESTVSPFLGGPGAGLWQCMAFLNVWQPGAVLRIDLEWKIVEHELDSDSLFRVRNFRKALGPLGLDRVVIR